MKDIRTTNILLLIIVIALFFYLIKLLSFIFIPLISSMFIAMLFLPLMRWLNKKSVPKPIAIFVVVVIITVVLKLGGVLVQISSNEIMSASGSFIENAEGKLVNLVGLFEDFFGIDQLRGESILAYFLKGNNVIEDFSSTIDFVGNSISMTLITVFFVILLLSESINFQQLLNNTLFKQKYSSIRIFMKIEKDIIRFVKVKFVISLFTGIGFSLACLFFDISFPIFWGLFAFFINFVQMVGSIISVVLLSLFAFVDISSTSTLLFFILTIVSVQALMGGVLEPIFMGRTFSLNVLTVIIMLMFWGYLWGVPGLIMSIPITVFLKIIFEQFPKTRVFANLMASSNQNVKYFNWKIFKKIEFARLK